MASPLVRSTAFLAGGCLAAVLTAWLIATPNVPFAAALLPLVIGNLVLGCLSLLLWLVAARLLPWQATGSSACFVAGLLPPLVAAWQGHHQPLLWAVSYLLLPLLCLSLLRQLGGIKRLSPFLILLSATVVAAFFFSFQVHFKLVDLLAMEAAPKLPAATAAEPAPTGPDIILVSIDTLRADAIVGPRPEGYELPWFDSVRARGSWWDFAYSSSNQTLPGHGSMLSGRDQPHVGIHDNQDALPSAERLPLVQQRFQEHGYRTAGVISNALIAGGMGFDRGFELYDDSTTLHLERMADCMAVLRDRSAFGLLPEPLQQKLLLQTSYHALRRPPVNINDVGLRSRGGVTNEQGLAVLDQLYAQDRPFFFFLHYLDPHHPYGAPEGFDGRVSGALPKPPAAFLGEAEGDFMIRMDQLVALRHELASEDPQRVAAAMDIAAYYHALYLENVMYLDSLLAAIEARVQASGRPAIWLITADHGEQFGENLSLIHGSHLYQDSVRVPMLTMGPGIPVAHRDEIPDLADVAPTLLGLVGIEPDQAMTGRPLLAKADWPVRGHVFADDARIGARLGEWKLIANRDPEQGFRPTALYRLTEDPEEAHNLLGQEAIPEALEALLRRALEEDQWQANGNISLNQANALNSLGYVGHDG